MNLRDAVIDECGGILPQYLEILPWAKHTPFQQIIDSTNEEAMAIFYLNTLVQPSTNVIFLEDRNIIDESMRSMWRDARASSSMKGSDIACFVLRHKSYEALKFLGLDIHGGVEKLHTCRQACTKYKVGFPMSAITVTNAEKARKYVNLGVHIGTDIPEHPSTLDEAIDACAKVSSLVGKSAPLGRASKQIESSQEVCPVWELRREEFRVKTRERYRQTVLDLAREEWLEDQVSGRGSFIN
tara:strand:+ start:15332 stop:16054 length:723 start_codon:yes stop_codon:yes gene_type:complete